MKSRSNHTARLPGRRLLIVNSVVILLLVNSIALVQSADTKNPIELSSWIEVSANNWPDKDTEGGNGEFLVYHSEYVTNSTLFGLNKKLSDDIDLVAVERPELSFRYWSSSDGSLRARSPSGPVRRDVKLTKGSWQNTVNEPVSAKTVRTDLKKISKEDWSNFAFISQDVFTLALKDVKVKYVQRVDLEKIPEVPEITAYNATNNFVNFTDLAAVKTPATPVVPAANPVSGPGGAAPFTGTEPKLVGANLVLETGTSTFKLAQNPKIIVLRAQIGGGAVEDVILTAAANGLAPKIEPATYEPYFKDTKSGAQVFTQLDVNVAATKKLTISKIIFGNSVLNGEDFFKNNLVPNTEVNKENKLVIKPGTFTFILKTQVAKIVLNVPLVGGGAEDVTITAKANEAPTVDKEQYKNILDSTPSPTAVLKDLKVKVATGTLTINKITLGADTQATDLKEFVKTLQPSTDVVGANKIVTFKARPLSTFKVPENVKTIALKAKIGNAALEDVTLTAGANGAAPKVEPAKYELYFKDTKSGAQVFTSLDVKVATGELAISQLIFDPTDVTVANFLATLERPQVPANTAEKLSVSVGTYTINVADKPVTKITFMWGSENVELTVGPRDTVKFNDEKFKEFFGQSKIVNGKFTLLKIVATADSSISEFKINADATAIPVAELEPKLIKETPSTTPTTPGTNTYEYQAPKEPTKDLVKGLVQLSEKNPTGGKDVCYKITKVGPKTPSIDVYLTLKDAKVGIKLNSIKSGDPSLKVCLFKYVALQNIGDYMISLVVQGDVQNGFKITVETKAEDIPKKSDIVAPSGPVKPDQWYLYNPHFDYSINAPSTSEFLICDIVANCYPYELDQTVFKLSSKIQAELVNTPFVRIQTSNTGKFVSENEKLFYENSRKQFKTKFEAENTKALKPNPTEKAKDSPTKLTVTYEVAFEASSNEATITVPFDVVDLRVQQLVATLSLDTTTHDDVAKKAKSPLSLTKVSIKKAVDQEPYDLPLSLGGEESVELRNGFTIGSDEIFSPEFAQVLTGASATFVLHLDTSVYKAAKVSLKIDILKSARKTVEDKGQAAKFTIANTFKSVPKVDTAKPNQVALDAKSNALLATSWIQSNDAASNAVIDTKFTIDVDSTVADDKKKLTDASKVEIYRIVTDQGNPKLSDKLTGTINGNVITFTETAVKVEVKGTFRVAYLIHSNVEDLKLKIIVDHFDVTGVVGSKDADNCKKEATRLFADCQYETLTCASTFGDTTGDGKACHLNKLNRLAEVKCDMSNGCANIFDSKLPVSKNYLRNDEVEYAPFQIDSSVRYLLYNRPSDQQTGDFCLDFIYTATESPLSVSTGSGGLSVLYPTTSVDKPNQDAKVCASWLTNDIEDVYGLYFSFVKGPLYDIDGHRLDIGAVTIGEEKSSVDEGIYINNLDSSLFEIQNEKDSSRWVFEKKELSNKLQFSITEEDLTTLPANAQADKYTALYSSTVRSKWVKVPYKEGHLSIGFVYDAGNSDFTDYKVQLSVNSPVKQVWHGDVSEIKANELFVVKDTSAGNYYQFEIDVVLNQTKLVDQIKKTPGNLIAGDLTLTFENFTINDPCVSQQNVLETCTAVSQGKCVRSYKEADYSHKCVCEKNFNGTHCELTDFCAKDKTSSRPICKKDKICQNDYDYGQVKCECGTDEVWNAYLQNCINIKTLNCGANEVLGSDQKCTCADGFVLIEKACVPFNPCEEPHRKAYNTKTRSNISPKACPNAETKCERIGTGTKPTDFNCKCEKGINKNLIMTPEATCLPDACSSCGTKDCKKVGNDWKCIDKECTVEGFELQQDPKDKDKKTCALNAKSSILISKFHCPDEVELKSDNQPGCKCGDQLFDAKTRGCLNECSAEMVAECTKRGAVSCSLNDKKKAQCACRDTDIPRATNETDLNDVESWMCKSQCEFLSLPDLQQLKCSGSFEHCDENVEFKNFLTASTTKDAKLIKGVFVKDTKLVAKKEQVCKCDEGFELWNDKCVPFEKPTHYIKGMEFDLHLTSGDLKAYLKATAETFEKLIKDILKADKIEVPNPSTAKCVKSGDTTISCSISFTSASEDKIIRKKLDEACVKVSDEKCIYLYQPKKTSGNRRKRQANNLVGGGAESLTHDIKKQKELETGVIDYCDPAAKRCAKYQYSSCRTDKVKPFECLCEEQKFFELADNVFLSGKNNMNLRMQICRVKNLCGVADSGFGCTDTNAKCHFNVEHDDAKNVYAPTAYCTCPGTNLTLAHQTLTCKQTCNAQCGNSVSCAQDYYTNAVSCNCKEGFSGATCGTKVESETTSKAYLISTIVVSIIAVIALIGLAVLYFRRR